jgi:hypothetical protein
MEPEQRHCPENSSNHSPKKNLSKEGELSPLVSLEAGEDKDNLSGLEQIVESGNYSIFFDNFQGLSVNEGFKYQQREDYPP